MSPVTRLLAELWKTTKRPFIEIEGLTKRFDDFVAVDSVDLKIYRRELFTILGGSGCGKSTLMKHMIGLNPPIGGSILIAGDDIVTADDEQLEKIQRRFGVMLLYCRRRTKITRPNGWIFKEWDQYQHHDGKCDCVQ